MKENLLNRVVNLAPECQPCSLHGGDACPLGHFRCLAELGVEQVWQEVEALITPDPTGSEHVR